MYVAGTRSKQEFTYIVWIDGDGNECRKECIVSQEYTIAGMKQRGDAASGER